MLHFARRPRYRRTFCFRFMAETVPLVQAIRSAISVRDNSVIESSLTIRSISSPFKQRPCRPILLLLLQFKNLPKCSHPVSHVTHPASHNVCNGRSFLAE